MEERLSLLGSLLVSLTPFPILHLGEVTLYLRDISSYYYPQAAFTARTLAEGSLALWHPRVGLGYPFHADPHSWLFYPLNFILLLFSFPLAYNLFTLVHYPIAAAGIWFLARDLGAGPLGRFAAAGVYTTAGIPLSSACVIVQLNATAWCPWVLWSFGRLLLKPGRRGLALTAVFLYLNGISSVPFYVIQTGGLMVLRLLLWLHQTGDGRLFRKGLTLLFLSAGLSGLLMSVQLIPLARVARLSTRAEGVEASDRQTYRLLPGNTYNLVLPLPKRNPMEAHFLGNYQGAGWQLIHNTYVGPVALLLAASGVSAAGRLSLGLGLTCAASLVMAMGKSAGLEPIVTGLLPPLQRFRFPIKYLFTFHLTLSLLVGLGVKRWVRAAGDSLGGLTRWLAGLGGLFLGISVVAPSFLPGWIVSFLGQEPGKPGLESLALDLATLHQGNLLAASLLLAALAGAAFWLDRGRRPARWAMVLLVMAMLGDLHWGNLGTQPLMDRAWFERPPRALRGLSPPDGSFRTLSLAPREEFRGLAGITGAMLAARELLSAQLAILHGYTVFGGPSSLLLASEAKLADAIPVTPADTRLRLLAAVNVKHVLSMDPLQVTSETATEFRAGPVHVYTMKNVTPRAFLAREALSVPAGHPLTSGSLRDLPRRVFFEETAELPAGTHFESVLPGTCEMERPGPNQVSVDVDSPEGGILVLLEGAYPGWEVRVDGAPREILTVCGVFRGVRVPPGSHGVEFLYRPRDLWLGGTLTLFGVVLVFWLVLAPRRLRLGQSVPTWRSQNQ